MKRFGDCSAKLRIGERVLITYHIYDEKEYPGEVTMFGDCSTKVHVMRQIFTGK